MRDSLDPVGNWFADQIQQGRQDIGVFHQCHALDALADRCAVENHRYADQTLVHPRSFGQQPVIAQPIAMISSEDNQGIVAHALAFQSLQDLADFIVKKGDHRIVIASDMAQPILRHGLFLAAARPISIQPIAVVLIGRALITEMLRAQVMLSGLCLWQADRAPFIQVGITFGRIERVMRIDKTGPEKQGLTGIVFFDRFDRFLTDPARLVIVFRHLAFPAIALETLWLAQCIGMFRRNSSDPVQVLTGGNIFSQMNLVKTVIGAICASDLIANSRILDGVGVVVPHLRTKMHFPCCDGAILAGFEPVTDGLF